MPLTTLILGTHNAKKGRELSELLVPLQIAVRTLDEFDAPLHVEETGATFAENAALKATEQAQYLGQWVLGEDSGLVVDALDGAPGIYSARFSGEEATDEANNQLLLKRLRNLKIEQRSAHYVCQMVLSDPTGKVCATSHGEFHGRIRTEPSGEGGFGYDPLFEIVEYHQTVAELGSAVKAVLSHRARAMRELVPQLISLREETSN